MLCTQIKETVMKNRLVFSLLSAALIALPTLAHADASQFEVLRVYKLASGQGVAVAIPGEWRELSTTRVLAAGAPARFIDEAGRRVEISSAELERASAAKSMAWATDGRVQTNVAAR
jgi:hypothetical protein